MDEKAHPTEQPPSYEPPPGGAQPGGSAGYFHPQQQPYPPPYPQPAGFVVQQPQAVVITTTPLGRVQVSITCPHCNQQVLTETRTSPSAMAWAAGAVIALLGCWCGCCLIPCMMDDLQDVEHSCPNCKAHVGRYRR